MLAATLLLASAQDVPRHVATTPAERLGEQWWRERHEQKVAVTKAGNVELAFLGDSITHSWEGGGKKAWDHYYAGRRAADFGFSGDRTEHVLWRLENGEVEGIKPKVAVLMIGTNNLGNKESVEDTIAGVKAVVKSLRDKLPETKVLLLAVFPRGAKADDAYFAASPINFVRSSSCLALLAGMLTRE